MCNIIFCRENGKLIPSFLARLTESVSYYEWFRKAALVPPLVIGRATTVTFGGVSCSAGPPSRTGEGCRVKGSPQRPGVFPGDGGAGQAKVSEA